MTETLLASLDRTWSLVRDKALQLFPRLLAALAVFLAGLLLAALARAIVRRGLKLAGFDRRWQRAGLALPEAWTRPGWSPTAMAGGLAFWATVLSASIFSLSALDMPLLDRMVEAFFLYLPKVAVAGVILALGFLLANFLARAALLLAVNEDLPSPRLLSGSTRLLVKLLASVMALEQLGVARTTVALAFAITFGAVMLALALAFGLGGQELAREFLARRLSEGRADHPEGLRHL